MFDATLQVVQIQVFDHEALGVENHIQLALIVGIGIPVAPGQVMQVPGGMLRIPMGRDVAIQHGQELVDAGEALPEEKKSDIVVASSLSGVDQAAEQVKKFRG